MIALDPVIPQATTPVRTGPTADPVVTKVKFPDDEEVPVPFVDNTWKLYSVAGVRPVIVAVWDVVSDVLSGDRNPRPAVGP
jgi:hypothetical protein